MDEERLWLTQRYELYMMHDASFADDQLSLDAKTLQEDGEAVLDRAVSSVPQSRG